MYVYTISIIQNTAQYCLPYIFVFFFLKKRPRMHKQCVVTADAENVLHVFEDKHSLFSQHVCANF